MTVHLCRTRSEPWRRYGHHRRPPVSDGLRGGPGRSPGAACADLDRRIGELRAQFGEIGDTGSPSWRHDGRRRRSPRAAVKTRASSEQEHGDAARTRAAASDERTQGRPGRDCDARSNAAAERIEKLHEESLNRTPRRAANVSQLIAAGGQPRTALHWRCGAARCVRSHIPGALSILKGAVPGRARGPGHMAPTYFRREPGIDTPTATRLRTFFVYNCFLNRSG